MIADGFDFSFSGLKTAVLHAVRASDDLDRDRPISPADFRMPCSTCWSRNWSARSAPPATPSPSSAAAWHATARCRRGPRKNWRDGPRGGRQSALQCDNAAMIARAGWHRLRLGERSDWTLDAAPTFRFRTRNCRD